MQIQKKDDLSSINIVNRQFVNEKDITIGLDFGTSATKCIINVENSDTKNDDYYAILFPQNGEPSFLFPTAIAYDDEHLYFGDLALTKSEEKIIYSCKMAIPCVRELEDYEPFCDLASCINEWNGYEQPYQWKERPGHFLFDSRYSLPSDELSILYLANVIKIIRDTVQNSFPDIKPKYYLNMACPLDKLKRDYLTSERDSDNYKRDNNIEERYNAISQYSLILSQYAKNPWNIQDAINYISKLRKFPLKGPENSEASVIPETLAAISSFIKRPGTEAGRYMAIDVGAGTTDISVFWLQKDIQQKPCYYSSGSLHKGVDQIDFILKNVFESYVGADSRQKREMFLKDNNNLDSCRSKIQPIIDEMLKHKRLTFGKGYKKERRGRVWGNREESTMKILLYGGGTKLDEIKGPFTDAPIWENFIGKACDSISLDIEICRKAIGLGLDQITINESNDLKKHSSLLLIAEGLAAKAVDIPEFNIQEEDIYTPQRIEMETLDY